MNDSTVATIPASDAAIEARISNDAPLALAEDSVTLMWMPGGRHQITPSQGDQPIMLDIEVRAEDAAKVQTAFEELCAAGPHRPYFDLEHDDKCAAVWPQRFFWRETPQPGIYAEGALSKAGKEAIEGKTHRGFSAVFFVDGIANKPARLVPRLKLNAGGFTNNPAFKKSLPLWAKEAHAAAVATDQTQTPTMPEQTTAAAAVQTAANPEVIAAKDAKILELQNQIKARDEAAAESAVKQAVQDGQIPPQDLALHAKWKAALAEDPSKLALLAALPKVQTAGTIVAPGAQQRAEVTDDDPRHIEKEMLSLKAKNGASGDIRAKAAVASEMGALYAKAIRGNKRFEDMPLKAATAADTLGTLSGTLVTLRALDLLKVQLFPLSAVTTDFSSEPAQYNQAITSRIITAPAVATYSATLGADGRPAGWVIGTPATSTDASVTLNAFKGVPVMFDAQTLASTARRLFAEFAEGAAYTLSKTMSDALLAIITSGNFATPIVAPVGDFGLVTLDGVNAVFNPAGVPMINRTLLLNTPYANKLRRDPTLAAYAAYQKPSIFEQNFIPPVATFNPVEVPHLPSTGNLAAFAMHKSALLIASRLPNDYTQALPGASNGSVTVVTNPDDGLSALLVEFVNHVGGYAERNIQVLYGVAKGNGSCGKIIKSA